MTSITDGLRQRDKDPTNVAKKNDASKKVTPTKQSKISTVNAELQRATSSSVHRLWTRAVIVLALMTLVYFYSKQHTKETKFALVREHLPLRMQKFKCAPTYEEEMRQYPRCVPKQCGRFVSDKVIEVKEAEILLHLARDIISRAGSAGGASILDLHTGALSYGEEFVNAYKLPNVMSYFQPQHMTVYNFVKGKIKKAITEQFDIPSDSLYLTYPTFFSRLTNMTAKTVHDEYWQEHVDKETYPSFHYTSLLYLNTHNKDFKGGRFIFVDGIGENRTTSFIEPKVARVSAFTSGAENRHHVEQVNEGERYAITISFTCNAKLGIADPKIQTID